MDLLWRELEKNANFFNDHEKNIVYKILDEYLFEEYLYDAVINEEIARKTLERLQFTFAASMYLLEELFNRRKIPIQIYNLSKRIGDVGKSDLKRLKIRVTKRLKSLDKDIGVNIDYVDLNEFEHSNILRRNIIDNVDDFHDMLVEYLCFVDADYMHRTLDPKVMKVILLDRNDKNFKLTEGDGFSAYRSPSCEEGIPCNDYILISVDKEYEFVDDTSVSILHELGHKLFLTHTEDLIYFMSGEENYTDEQRYMVKYLLYKNPSIMSGFEIFSCPNRFNFMDRIELYSVKELYKIARDSIDFIR